MRNDATPRSGTTMGVHLESWSKTSCASWVSSYGLGAAREQKRLLCSRTTNRVVAWGTERSAVAQPQSILFTITHESTESFRMTSRHAFRNPLRDPRSLIFRSPGQAANAGGPGLRLGAAIVL